MLCISKCFVDIFVQWLTSKIQQESLHCKQNVIFVSVQGKSDTSEVSKNLEINEECKKENSNVFSHFECGKRLYSEPSRMVYTLRNAVKNKQSIHSISYDWILFEKTSIEFCSWSQTDWSYQSSSSFWLFRRESRCTACVTFQCLWK